MSRLACLALAFLPISAGAVELRWPEGTLRGFPVIRDARGGLLADGNLTQWVEHGNLHVKGVFDFRDGRRVEEEAQLRQQPILEQLRWTWTERRGQEMLRRFEVDFATGAAKAQKREGDELKHWEETLEIKPGTTFAGVGFMFAVKNLRDRLDAGEKVQLTAVAFTPKPRTATVTISHEAVERLHMDGRSLEADRFLIHPEVPAIAKIFVKAPDQHLWFYRSPPPALLRAEGPLAEPDDPIVHIDVLRGTSPAEARPAPARERGSKKIAPR